MAEIINSNVFDANKKFVDFAGLDYFWDKAKAYVDGVDSAIAGRVTALETTVNGVEGTEGLVKKVSDLRKDFDALGGAEGGIQSMIDSTIESLKLPETYDAKGAAEAAETAAKTYADGLVTNTDGTAKFDTNGAAAAAETAAKAYADGLASNYDAAGSAEAAETAAKTYADGLASNYDAKGSAAAAQTAAEATAKAYTDTVAGAYAEGETPASGLRAEIAEVAANADSALSTHEANTTLHITAEERTAWNAAKTSIDTFLKDADMTEKAVDTLKELQDYMTSDGAAAAELVNRVAALEAIDHEAYKAYADQAEADAIAAAATDATTKANTAETNAKGYADTQISATVGAYEAEGVTASGLRAEIASRDAQTLTDAKAYADGLASNYDAKGAAAAAETAAKAYADSLASNYDAAGSAEAAKNAAIAQAKADAAEALKAYMTKTETEAAIKVVSDDLSTLTGNLKSAAYVTVESLEATMDSKDSAIDTKAQGYATTAETNAKTYAKTYSETYTNALFNSIQFASNSDIDTIFTVVNA